MQFMQKRQELCCSLDPRNIQDLIFLSWFEIYMTVSRYSGVFIHPTQPLVDFFSRKTSSNFFI